MKFGKQLEHLSLPKFKGYYVQYNKIKDAIKVFTGQEQDKSTVEQVTHWTSSFLRLGPNPETPPEAQLNELVTHEVARISRHSASVGDKLRASLQELVLDIRQGRGSHAENLRRLDELGDDIVDLKSFAQLNFTGFRKLLKKYDKWSNSTVTAWFMAQVMSSPFMNVDYDGLLGLLNRAAVLLQQTEALVVPHRKGSSEFDLRGSQHFTFFIDPKDAMRVKVQFAKHFDRPAGAQEDDPEVEQRANVKRAPSSFLDTPKPSAKPQTVSVFFDTPGLSVYSARAAAERGAAAAAKQPSKASLHLRYGDGNEVHVVREGSHEAAREEAVLSRADTSRLFTGQAVAVPPLPPDGGAKKRLLEAVRGMVTGADPMAPVARASYTRCTYHQGDLTHRVTALFDEDVWISGAREWDSPAARPEFFPYAILSISFASGGELELTPSWLQRIRDSPTVFQVAGFSKAAHVVAHFRAEELGLPMPHWYASVKNRRILRDDAGDADAADEPPGEDRGDAPAGELPEFGGGPGGGASRLLHEFGTSPELVPTPVQSPTMQVRASSAAATVAPSDDRNALDTPLLGPAADRDRLDACAEEEEDAAPGLLDRALRWLAGARSARAAAKPMRLAIVAVQPKTLFSNERTLLEWLHFAVMFAGFGMVLLHADGGNPHIGRCILAGSIFFAAWALRTFNWRADALDSKEARNYHDPIGPPVLVLSLLAALVLSSLHAVGAFEPDKVGAPVT